MAKSAKPALPDSIALVLQGGGALGAYQAGVYEGLDAQGVVPDWLAGISIGAINTALIAGNAPGRRVDALHEFWETVTQPPLLPATTFGQDAALVGLAGPARMALDSWEAWRALSEGQHGFFHPRDGLSLLDADDPMVACDPTMASWYDTRPLLDTLNRLVDFDRLNRGSIRVSVGAVNVATGNLEYFDNRRMLLDARHILASGALPPAFPAVEIDGQYYWDGGLVSNTPLSRVLSDPDRCDMLIFQVDLWPARGELPKTLLDVEERIKEIRYSSRTRQISDTQRLDRHYRRLLRELLEELTPQQRRNSAWARRAEQLARRDRIALIHLIYRDCAHIGHFKDFQFGRVSMREHWAAGQADIARALAHPEWLQLPEGADGFVVHDANREG